MAYEHMDDHVEAGLALLIDHYKEKPVLEAYIRSFLSRIQELEDAIRDVIVGRLLDTATGAQLDILGAIVGQSRTSEDDDLFRARIRTRILANRSRGNPIDIIAVARSALGSDDLTYTELYPATVLVETIEAVSSASAAVIAEFLRAAKSAGTRITYHYSSDDGEDTFAFSSSDDPEPDTSRGFGGDDPTTGNGGRWIGAHL